MNKKEVKSQISKLTEGIFSVYDITEINHNPHPYMVGPKHIQHASDNFGGLLDERTTDVVGCAHPHCGMDYQSHTYDTVVALKLLKNLTNSEANDSLQSLLPIFEKEGIDGVIFIESKENFRIT